VVAALVAAALAAGCAGREFAEVEGTVTLDGAPLLEVEVVFVPDPDRGPGGNNATAYTDEHGRYRLRAVRDGRDGAAVGWYRVVFIDLAAVTDVSKFGAPRGGEVAVAPTKPKARRFPPVFADLALTPHKVEIRPGKQKLDFDLKAKGE
jgi:hypothetical protein